MGKVDESLPLAVAPPPSPPSSRSRQLAALVLLLPVAVWLTVPSHTVLSYLPGCIHHSRDLSTSAASLAGAVCPLQPEPLNVGVDWKPEEDAEYVRKAVERLQGAVRVRTESFDDMGGPDDPRFEVMAPLHAYLESTFPRVYSTLQVDKIATYGILATWKGSDESLKPVVFMAHQDTVPVPDGTLDRWTHPPFEAVEDKKGWIWGRGTTDCKNTLLALFGTLDKLIEDGHQPTRTIILSSGFDEEIGGSRSAGPLARELESRYGKDGIALIVDEGFTGVDTAYGETFARFGMAEKGAVSLSLEVLSEGGHSSVPHGATGIGNLARLLVALEDHPDSPKLEKGNPILQELACGVEHGEVDKRTRKQLRDPKQWKKLGEELAKDDILRAFLSTTQATDLVQGGVKLNALPEYVSASINYRISFLSSVNATLERISSILSPVVASLSPSYTFDSFGSHSNVTNKVVRLSILGDSPIEPAPLTPAEGPAWELMAGTTRHVWPGAVASPSGMVANTDTKHTWNLTKHIYRFLPAPLELVKNFHTVDERIHRDAHLSNIRFFYKLIQNVEGWQSE